MTAAPVPNISIPLHEREPANAADHAEWTIERLLSHHADSGEQWPLAMIRKHRSDLSDEALQDLVDDVFATAADLTEATVIGQARRIERDECRYAEALSALATRPDDLCDLIDAVQDTNVVSLHAVRGERL